MVGSRSWTGNNDGWMSMTRSSCLPAPYTHRVAPESGYFINDFHYVTDWSPRKQTDVHKADREFLETALTDIRATKPQSRVLIATHYAPLYGPAVPPKHRDSPLNGFFLQRHSGSFVEQVSHGISRHLAIWPYTLQCERESATRTGCQSPIQRRHFEAQISLRIDDIKDSRT